MVFCFYSVKVIRELPYLFPVLADMYPLFFSIEGFLISAITSNTLYFLYISILKSADYKSAGTDKELDTKKGLNWYDYGARHYDTAIGRFTTMDPMAEKYYAVSPYTYCVNNPIKFVDPTGMLTESPQTGSIRLSFWDKIKNAFNDLFSFTVDISSEEAKQKTAQKYNRQMSTLQSLNDGVEAVNTVMSIVNPVASVAELAANIQGENTKGIVLAGAMVALE